MFFKIKYIAFKIKVLISNTMGYLEQELHVLNMLNIRGSQRNLGVLSPTEKNQYLRNYSNYIHKNTLNLNGFYSNYNKTDTVLFHTLELVMA